MNSLFSGDCNEMSGRSKMKPLRSKHTVISSSAGRMPAAANRNAKGVAQGRKIGGASTGIAGAAWGKSVP